MRRVRTLGDLGSRGEWRPDRADRRHRDVHGWLLPLFDPPDTNDHLSGVALAGADEDRTRQPLKLRSGSLECGDCLEVYERRIGRLSREELLRDVGRGMAHAGILNVDELSGVGLEHVASVELRQTIGAHDLPVGSARHDLAADLRSIEGAAEDWNDAAP